MKAHNNYIAVKLIDEEQGGVIIPDVYKNTSPKGEVVSVGHLVKDINVGDIIYYHATTGYKYDGQEFIEAEQVFGKLWDI